MPLTARAAFIFVGLPLLALVPPSTSILRAALAIPFWISLLVTLITIWTIAAVVRSRRLQSPSTLRRYGRPTLGFETPSAWSAVRTRAQWEVYPSRSNSIHGAATEELDRRLDGIFELIRSSFILPWFSRISPSPIFPNTVEVLIRATLTNVVARAEDIDWSTLMVSRLTPIVTDHLYHYRTVEHLSSTSSAPTPNAALPLPLPTRTHPALAQETHVSAKNPLAHVEAHFRTTLDRVVEQALPEKDASDVVKTLAREVVLGTILLPVFEMLCDSDFWNRQIDEKGGRYLHEQKQVNKFLSALSSLPEELNNSRTSSPIRSKALPTPSSITAQSSTRQFEAFLRSIPKVKTLGEARRLRADVDREYRLAKTELDAMSSLGRAEHDAEKHVKRTRKYLKRLDRARLEVDARISVLSRSPGKPAAPPVHAATSTMMVDPSDYAHVDLFTVLSDPSSLAYWLEYMDRRARSRLVQFWLTVEGFKDPLEGIGQNATLDGTLIASDMQTPQNAQTVYEDVSFLRETYFTATDQLLAISTRHVAVIEELVQNGRLAPPDVRRAKQAMFACQQAVYEQMQEEDWAGFKKSELYIKACSDLSKGSMIPRSPVNSPKVASFPFLPTSSAPPVPVRQQSAPALPPRKAVTGKGPMSPPTRTLPLLSGGQFTPTSVTPAASISLSPPDMDRRVSEIRPSMSHQLSHYRHGLPSSVPTTPPVNVRRSSQLDFLIGDDEGKKVSSKLFDDEQEGEDGVGDEEEDDFVQVQRMEAIQAALNEIIASDDMVASRTIKPDSAAATPEAEVAQPLMSSSMILSPKVETTDPLGKIVSRSVEDLRAIQPRRTHSSAPASRVPSGTPGLSHRSSLSELNKRSKLLFDDEMIQEIPDDERSERDDGDGLRQMAIPSDAQLEVEIAQLQEKIQELVKQEHLLDALIRQAELTGNAAELRILNRSQASVRREQRTAIFQKAQFEQHEEEGRIVSGLTVVSIPSAVIVTDDGESGKQVVRYSVSVRQGVSAADDIPHWTVTRRYNEFWELDRGLRDWAGANGHAALLKGMEELPPKKLVPNLSASFIESRRQGLEKYLQRVVSEPVLCESLLLSTFLSRSAGAQHSLSSSNALASLAPHNIVKSLYKTMATSLDDNLLGPNMLDMIQTTLTRQLTDFGGLVGIASDDIAGIGSSFLSQALKAGWSKDLPSPPLAGPASATATSPSATSSLGPIALGGESGTGSFTAPICDLFVEVFDLKENNWLRRQAIVVILQQFLGSTIERKVRDTVKNAMSADSVERGLAGFQEVLWPGGERRPPSTPRTEEEKLETKMRASRKLGLLIPDIAANMIGRGNARRAARRVFGVLQDKRLNQHLMLCIMDEVLNAMFPPRKKG